MAWWVATSESFVTAKLISTSKGYQGWARGQMERINKVTAMWTWQEQKAGYSFSIFQVKVTAHCLLSAFHSTLYSWDLTAGSSTIILVESVLDSSFLKFVKKKLLVTKTTSMHTKQYSLMCIRTMTEKLETYHAPALFI